MDNSYNLAALLSTGFDAANDGATVGTTVGTNFNPYGLFLVYDLYLPVT